MDVFANFSHDDIFLSPNNSIFIFFRIDVMYCTHGHVKLSPDLLHQDHRWLADIQAYSSLHRVLPPLPAPAWQAPRPQQPTPRRGLSRQAGSGDLRQNGQSHVRRRSTSLLQFICQHSSQSFLFTLYFST